MLHPRGKISFLKKKIYIYIYIYMIEASMYFKYEDFHAKESKLWDTLI
jgi:hypothetical protein